MAALDTPSSSPVSATGAALHPWAWRAAAVTAGATILFSAAAWAASTVKPVPQPAPAASVAPAGAQLAPPTGMPGEAGPHGAGHGHHHGPDGMRGHGPMGGAGMMLDGRHLDRALSQVKATDTQRTQIRGIVDQARADVRSLHEQGRKLHEEGLTLWAAPKLDEQAIEAHRQKMNTLRDQASARMAQAMLEAGKVLQPEQRAELVKHLQARQGRFEAMRAHGHDRMGHGKGGPAAPAAPASGPVH